MNDFIKKIWDKRPALSIYWKIFISFSLVSFILFSVITMYSLRVSTSTLEQQKIEEMRSDIDEIENYLDLLLSKIRSNFLLISKDNRLSNGSKEEIQRMLNDYKESNSDYVVQAVYFNKNGIGFSDMSTLFDILPQPKLQDIYNMGMKGSDTIQWTEMYYSSVATSQTIALFKPVKNLTGKYEGVLIIELNLPNLIAAISKAAIRTGCTLTIKTSEGDLLPAYQFAEESNSEKGARLLERNDLFSSDISKLLNEKQNLVVVNNTASMGWKLQISYNKKAIWSKTEELERGYIKAGLLYLILILITSLALSRHFTKYIRLLAKKMKKTTIEYTQLPVTVDRKDEIGDLYKSFNYMLQELKQLIERKINDEREKRIIEIKLLQSQIKPHFLGNTLACIRSLAREQKYDDIEKIVKGVILLLRHSIDSTKELVTLKKELEIVEAYVEVQKIKYGNTFSYESDVDEKFQNIQVPKLLLQPLVENAIFHGLSSMESGKIKISAHGDNGKIFICVEDNGVGMDKKKLDKLSGKAEEMPPEMQQGHFSSIGVGNVRDRVKLYYGEEYEVSITSEAGNGTKVYLELPYQN